MTRGVLVLPADYAAWLTDLEQRIRGARQRALLAANEEQVRLYHQIGRDILDRQRRQGWGAKVIDRLSADLRAAFPDMKGLSTRNLKYMKVFAEHCPDGRIGQQSAAQLPWFHIVTLLTRVSDAAHREWYARAALEHAWSRDMLAHERDIEGALVRHVTRFLLELGAGFAFVGRQFRLEVGGDEFFLDLLFYHTRLKCFVVVELKAQAFEPERNTPCRGSPSRSVSRHTSSCGVCRSRSTRACPRSRRSRPRCRAVWARNWRRDDAASSDFMVQLTQAESAALRSQSVTAKTGRGGRRTRFSAAPCLPGRQHGARQVHQQEARDGRVGRRRRRRARRDHRPPLSRHSRVHTTQPLSHAAVLRELSRPDESVTTGDTIARPRLLPREREVERATYDAAGRVDPQ